MNNTEIFELFPNLLSLDLTNNNIKTYVVGQSLSKLENFFLNAENLSEIIGLNSLVNLKSLQIFRTKIEEIDIEKLKNLEILSLPRNNLKQLNGLGKLLNLKELDIADNPINELENINNLNNLEGFVIRGTNLSESRINAIRTLIKKNKSL